MSKTPAYSLRLNRACADLVLARLRFLSCPVAVSETFAGVNDQPVHAEQWALAAWALTDALRLGETVEMDRIYTALLVEALEGSQVIRLAPLAERAELIERANELAEYLAPYAGRPVTPDIGPLAA